MTATTPEGEPKLVPACTLPLTAVGVVKVVITEHAVFRLLDGELVLTELLDGATRRQSPPRRARATASDWARRPARSS